MQRYKVSSNIPRKCGINLSDQAVLGALVLGHDGIDGGNGGDGDDVAHAALEVGEVNGLVKAYLQGTDNFHFGRHVLDELAGHVGAGEVGEHQCVHVLAAKASEGVLAVAQFLVKGYVDLHLTIDET